MSGHNVIEGIGMALDDREYYREELRRWRGVPAGGWQQPSSTPTKHCILGKPPIDVASLKVAMPPPPVEPPPLSPDEQRMAMLYGRAAAHLQAAVNRHLELDDIVAHQPIAHNVRANLATPFSRWWLWASASVALVLVGYVAGYVIAL